MTSIASAQAVEQVLALPFLLMGLSHALQPQLWIGFFHSLEAQGEQAVIWRSFALELWPSVLIVSFHQDWSWPGIIVTLYGHALAAKIALALLVPSLGRRTLHYASSYNGNGMRVAGIFLIALGLFCSCRALS